MSGPDNAISCDDLERRLLSRAGAEEQQQHQHQHQQQLQQQAAQLQQTAGTPQDRSALSLGSGAHQTGDCRPCAWFWKPAGCRNGQVCLHCHLCPSGALKARRKEKVASMRPSIDHASWLGFSNFGSQQLMAPEGYVFPGCIQASAMQPVALQQEYVPLVAFPPSGAQVIAVPGVVSQQPVANMISYDDAAVESFGEAKTTHKPSQSAVCLDLARMLVDPNADSIESELEGGERDTLAAPLCRKLSVSTTASDQSIGQADVFGAAAVDSSSDSGLPSVGSALHSTGECRPCAWFWKHSGCLLQRACHHCHLCPEGELKRRKKIKALAIRESLQAEQHGSTQMLFESHQTIDNQSITSDCQTSGQQRQEDTSSYLLALPLVPVHVQTDVQLYDQDSQLEALSTLLMDRMFSPGDIRLPLQVH